MRRPLRLAAAVLGGLSLAAYAAVSLVLRADHWDSALPSLSFVNVRDRECRVPVLDPLAPEVLPFLREVEPIDCATRHGTLTVFDVKSGTLSINETHLRAFPVELKGIHCQYRCFRRNEGVDDDSLIHSDWVSFSAPTKPSCEFLQVGCTQLTLIPTHSAIYANVRRRKDATRRTAETPDVVMIILDSTSRSNAIRYIPRFIRHFNETFNATLFSRHSVMGSNSRPNACGFLLDKYVSEVEGPIAPDALPLIWKNFSSAGYATLFDEDKILWPVFSHLNGTGFKTKPADEYMRPFFLQLDGGKLMILVRDEQCALNRPKLGVMLEHVGNFLDMHNDAPTFSLVWSSDLSHEYIHAIANGEEDLINFLNNNEKRLQESFVFILGDHGHRRDNIRQTDTGRLEARLPFFQMSIPSSLRAESPQILETLERNTGALTSHFDVYATLADILHGGYRRDSAQAASLSTHGGLSLLRPIPRKRSCADAGIPAEFCSCTRRDAEQGISPEDPDAMRAAATLTAELGRMLGGRSECVALTLDAVKTATRLKKPGLPSIRVVFSVAPSAAVFEGAVLMVQEPKLIGSLDRINTFGNQSRCIDDEMLKPYCFCSS